MNSNLLNIKKQISETIPNVLFLLMPLKTLNSLIYTLGFCLERKFSRKIIDSRKNFPAYKQSVGCISNEDGLEWLNVVNWNLASVRLRKIFYSIQSKIYF